MIRPALALALLAGRAYGGELEVGERTVRVDVTSTTTTGYRVEPVPYGELLERLNIGAALARWSASLRLDTSTYVLEDAGQDIDHRYTLEKVAAGWTGRTVTVTAGDAYVAFGRGLALSLRKVDQLGVDTTLRGAKLLVQRDAFGLTLAAGTPNIQNIDEATGVSVDDPYDLLAGLEAHARIADKVTVGMHGVGVGFRESLGLVPAGAYADRVLHTGVTIDAARLAKRFGFYLEGLGQLRGGPSTGEDTRGFGLYGTATARIHDDVALLFEGKAYGDLAPLHPDLGAPELATVQYNQLPTVERVLQILEHPQRDVAGGRLRADWTISPALLVYASHGVFRDWFGYDDPGEVGVARAGTIYDPYAGVEARWNAGQSHAIASAGWRGVALAGKQTIVREDLHAELDLAQRLNRCWSLTLHVLHVERHAFESPILDLRFRQGTILAGARFRSRLSAALGYDYTTEPTQPKRDYVNASVQWSFTSSSSVRVVAGSTRGGLACVAGACRVFPSFEGVRLTATLRY